MSKETIVDAERALREKRERLDTSSNAWEKRKRRENVTKALKENQN